MKSFIRRLFLFLFIYLTLSAVISFFTPYHWGNPWYSSKIQYLERADNKQLNTFFFGSSRIYRQIDPKVFDKTVNASASGAEDINSFNLGASATFNPQSYYLYEKFINSKLAGQARFCFIELMDVDQLSDFFMHQERTSYWQNFSDLVFVGKSVISNNSLPTGKKVSSFSNYFTSYIENLFHLGHFGKQIVTTDYYSEKYVGELKNGFFSLEKNYKTTDSKKVKKHLKIRKESIINDPDILITRRESVIKAHERVSDDYDKVNLERINKLIEKSDKKGIRLIFILSPRIDKQRTINLSKQIPAENLIDLSDPRKYEQLYRKENSFDVGHLNEQGAELYSRILAEEFLKLFENEY